VNATSGVIGEAWRLYKAHWRHLLTFSFVVYAGVAVIGAVLTLALTWVGAIIAAIVSLIAFFWLQGALVKAVDDVRDGNADLSLGQTFAQAREQLSSVAVAAILAGLGIVLGLLLLIVPGLVLMTWWAVIIPVVVLENRSAGESFTRSRELVRGNGWGVFGVIVLMVLLLIGFSFLLSIILSPLADWAQSFVSQIVSGTVTAPFVAIVLTLLYFRLRQAKEPVAETSAPAASV
jgi:hypothetical protein